MRFEWDPTKAAQNWSKHGVSFEEASTLFEDPFFLIFLDPMHSEIEERSLILGLSERGRALMAVYTDREDRVRIISAREATPKERRKYEQEPRP